MLLKYNGLPGVQHIAFLTSNIINTLQILQNNGVELLNVPSSYYENLSQNIKLNYKKIFLLQVFTKPIQTKPTLFYEIIQREEAVIVNMREVRFYSKIESLTP